MKLADIARDVSEYLAVIAEDAAHCSQPEEICATDYRELMGKLGRLQTALAECLLMPERDPSEGIPVRVRFGDHEEFVAGILR